MDALRAARRFAGRGTPTRAESVQQVSTWSETGRQGTGRSRLHTAVVRWREPIDGQWTVRVTVGHLHNDAAKKKDVKQRRQFFDELAECCAGGTRIVGLDANMALLGVVQELFERNVDATLIARHQEFGHDEVLRATTHALPELPTTKHPRPRSSSQHMGHIHGCTYNSACIAGSFPAGINIVKLRMG